VLLLDNQELVVFLPFLPYFPLMSIGIEAEVANRHLAFVGDMGGCPGDKLQVIHLLHLFALFPVPVAYLALFLIEAKTLQGEQWPDHVFAHPLGLLPGGSFDLAVDRKA